jgi:hypothetical protein
MGSREEPGDFAGVADRIGRLTWFRRFLLLVIVPESRASRKYRFVRRISTEKRPAGQEIEDTIMLFAAATGGRFRWRKANANEHRKRFSSYRILNNRNLRL